MFNLNPQSGTPIYRQLIEQVRRMVSSAQLKPGDNMPSVRELAMSNAVNPMTISKAYSILQAEGLLSRVRGKGMIIANRPSLSENKNERIERIQEILDQLVEAADQLELNSEDVLSALKQSMEKKK